jgi:hypothetical protein
MNFPIWQKFAVMIFGILGLYIRIWISKKKISPILGSSKRYFSRYLSCYFWVDMITLFTLEPLFIITFGSLPLLYLCIGADIKFMVRFIRKIKEDANLKQYLPYVIYDRLTLHLPLLLLSNYYWIIGVKTFHAEIAWYSFILAYFLFLIPFLLFDPRWPERRLDGVIMFYGSFILFLLCMMFYWGHIGF